MHCQNHWESKQNINVEKSWIFTPVPSLLISSLLLNMGHSSYSLDAPGYQVFTPRLELISSIPLAYLGFQLIAETLWEFYFIIIQIRNQYQITNLYFYIFNLWMFIFTFTFLFSNMYTPNNNKFGSFIFTKILTMVE